MGKIVDAIIARLIIFVAITIVALFLVKSALTAVAISTVLTLIISICIAGIEKKQKVKAIKLKKFNTYMIVYGFDTVSETIEKILPGSQKKNGYMLTASNAVIMPAYKFSKVNKDDIIKAYRTAISENATDVYIIGIEADREALLFSTTLSGKKFFFIPSKVFYKAAKANNILPKDTISVKSEKIRFKDILLILFSKNNAKRFLVASVFLLLLSFLTPLKNYYLAISAVTLLFAVISLFSKNAKEDASKYGIFAKYQSKTDNGSDNEIEPSENSETDERNNDET